MHNGVHEIDYRRVEVVFFGEFVCNLTSENALDRL